MASQIPLAAFEADTDGVPPTAKALKRARLVCFRCHEKKIKCDLAKKSELNDVTGTGQGLQCSNCVDADCPCQLRPSRRGKRRTAPGNGQGRRPEELDAGRFADDVFDTAFVPLAIDDLPSQPSSQDGYAEPPLDDASMGDLQRRHSATLETSESGFSELVGVRSDRTMHGSNMPEDVGRRRILSSYLGDSGFMPIFSGRSEHIIQQPLPPFLQQVDYTPASLFEGHLDVYFEYAYTWCPVLDREMLESVPSLRQSLLLRHALAVCANQIRPSLLRYNSSSEHYERAKELFYSNQEPNPLVRVIALMLLYWWSPAPPNIVNIDNTAWWTGTAIQLVQQLGFHREPRSGTPSMIAESPGLRRRILWTLVARERITSIAQGRPCLVDLDDCNVPMPKPTDFLQPCDMKISIFVRWIRLCELVGRIGKMLRQRRWKEPQCDTASSVKAINFAEELISWIQEMPTSLQPAFEHARGHTFNREVHGLHLTYLSTITLLHLDKGTQTLPRASVAAIVAASCTARIFRDYLVRGSVSFLAGQAGWYIAIAVLALLQARGIEGLSAHADADIDVLRAALEVLAETWSSAQMFKTAIGGMVTKKACQDKTSSGEPAGIFYNGTDDTTSTSPSMDELSASAGIKWQDYFPYVTSQTSPLIGFLFAQGHQGALVAEGGWMFESSEQLNQFRFGLETLDNLDFLTL